MLRPEFLGNTSLVPIPVSCAIPLLQQLSSCCLRSLWLPPHSCSPRYPLPVAGSSSVVGGQDPISLPLSHTDFREHGGIGRAWGSISLLGLSLFCLHTCFSPVLEKSYIKPLLSRSLTESTK